MNGVLRLSWLWNGLPKVVDGPAIAFAVDALGIMDPKAGGFVGF